MNHDLIQHISDEATEYILAKYKRLFPYCGQGAARFVTLARKEGIKARKVSGLYRATQHMWCVLEDGTIVDPTAGQFNRANGIQSITTPYEEIPSELIASLPFRDISSAFGMSLQEAWWAWQRLVRAGAPRIEERGEYKTETRTDKKGRTYMYESHTVRFTWDRDKKLRSRVIWREGSTIHGFSTYQRRFVGKDGKVKYPTFQQRFIQIERNGLTLSKEGKGPWQLGEIIYNYQEA